MYGKYSQLYDKWCSCYDVSNKEISIINEFVDLRGATVLDVGCGTGRLTMRVAKEAREVHGVDLDSYSIDILNEKISKSKIGNIKTYCTDISTASFCKAMFDVVIFSWSLYSIPKNDLTALFEIIQRWIKDHGSILVLQPECGQFEEVMRSAFVENQDHEEYDNCLEYLKTLSQGAFVLDSEFVIHQYFEFTDLSFGIEAIKMFAVTEGSYSGTIESIKSKPISQLLGKYYDGNKYVLDDYVRGFVFRKM